MGRDIDRVRRHNARWIERYKASPGTVVAQMAPLSGGLMPPQGNERELLGMYREWVSTCVDKVGDEVAATKLRVYTTRRSAKSTALLRTKSVAAPILRELERRAHLKRYLEGIGEVVEVVEHPFLELWEHGSPLLSGSALKRLICSHIDLVGDSFTYIVPDVDGIPMYLLCLPPDEMRVVLGGIGLIAGYIQKHGTVETEYAPEEIMHIKWVDPDNPVYGKSPLEKVELTATLYHRFTEFDMALMDNGAVPGMVGMTDAALSRTQRRRAERSWNEDHRGALKAGKFRIVSGLTELKEFGLSPKDMQHIEGRTVARQSIAAAYGVADSLLVPGNNSQANVKVGEYSTAKHGVRPRCHLLEDSINRDIISLYDGKGLFVAFDNPVPGDEKADLARGQLANTTHKLVRKNEFRRMIGLDADEELGDEWIEQREPTTWNLPRQRDDTVPPINDDGDDEKAVHITIAKSVPDIEDTGLQSTLKELFRVQRDKILLDLGLKAKGFREDFDEDFDEDEWTEVFEEECRPHIVRDLLIGAAAAMLLLPGDEQFDPQQPPVQRFIRDYTHRFARGVNRTTKGSLQELLSNADAQGLSRREITRQVQELFGHAEKYRAERIARTEASRSVMAGEVEAYKQSGVVEGYHWVAQPGACEFCLEVASQYGPEGTTMRLGGSFFERGDSVDGAEGGTMQLDYSDIPHPPLHPNCRCGLEVVLIGES